MRHTFTLFCFAFFVTACINPMKLVEANEYDRAYKVSKRQLDQRIRRDKPAKTEELAALYRSYLQLQDRSIQQIITLEAEGEARRWLRVYRLYSDLLHRRYDVMPYADLFTNFGYRYELGELEALTENARLEAGGYCFDQAATSFPDARENRKFAARTAHRWLLLALDYVPEDQNYHDHLAEMRDLGTVRILLNNSHENRRAWHSLDVATVHPSFNAWRKDWLEVHYRQPALRIDYKARIHLTGLDVSWDQEDRSTETFSAEVICGYRTEKKEVKQDSVWVTVEEQIPIYTTVYAQITTVEQYKSAWGAAQVELIPIAGLRPGQWWDTSEQVDWSNTYEICSGDDRALPSSCSGSCGFYPSDGEMIDEVGDGLRGGAIYRLCNYFPDSQLSRQERRALGWK